MTDIALIWDDAAFAADLALSNGDLATDDGLRTAIILSLFTDRLAEPDDDLPSPGDRRGWWGDALAEVAGDRIGSRLWLLDREKKLPSVIARMKVYAAEALAWLVDDGIAAAVEIEAAIIEPATRAIGVTLIRPTGPARQRYDFAWEASALMPFARPTLTTLVERSRDDFDAWLPGADSRLRRSVLGVLARVIGGAVNGLYGLLDWLARQILPDTAETGQLVRWAAIWGMGRKPAVVAAGAATATGTDGAAIATGTELQRGDGVAYLVTADAVITGGVAALSIAAVDAGIGGDASAGQLLTFSSPVAGVSASATVAGGGVGGGAAEESDELLRARLLERIRQPPAGGNATDYLRWAKEVAGVTRAWVYPLALGPGTVTVLFVCDAREDIIPTGDDVARVAAHIALLRPVTAAVTVAAPTPAPIDFTIALTPPTDAVKAAVIAELADVIAREAEPGGTILKSHLDEAIAIAAGETDHAMTAPAANVTAATGAMPVLGEVTWA